MSTHVYDIRRKTFDPNDEHPAFSLLAPWQDLREGIEADSPLLARFPPAELRRRWEAGLAVIAIELTQIVAYTSLVPVPIDLPDSRVFEASSGWTRPGWRRMGLQVHLRRHLYHDKGDDLLISFGVGLGAAYVLRQLGWSLYSWPDRLGVSDFIGEVADGKLYHRLGDAIALSGREPFRINESVNLDQHDWNRYLHLWVSNADRATSLRQRILREAG